MAARPRKMDPIGKRAAIMGVGERLFAERGFAGVSMADIAAGADVAVGTLYRLFPDKAALLGALHERMEDRFIGVMLRAWAKPTDYPGKLRGLVNALFKEALAVADLMPLYSLTRDVVGQVDYRPGERTIAAIAPLFREGRAARSFVDMDPDLAARMAYALVEAGMFQLMSAANAAERKRLIKQSSDLMVRAFLAP